MIGVLAGWVVVVVAAYGVGWALDYFYGKRPTTKKKGGKRKK